MSVMHVPRIEQREIGRGHQRRLERTDLHLAARPSSSLCSAAIFTECFAVEGQRHFVQRTQAGDAHCRCIQPLATIQFFHKAILRRAKRDNGTNGNKRNKRKNKLISVCSVYFRLFRYLSSTLTETIPKHLG